MTTEPEPTGPEGVSPTRWQERISDATGVERKWRDAGREVVKIYRAEKTADGSAGRGRFNMLFANTSILFPSVYQQPPQADVRRRFQTPDAMADAASTIVQGALNSAFDAGNLDAEIRRAVQEVLLPGRGTIRVRWAPVVEEQPVLDQMGQPMAGEDGKPVTEPRKVWEALEFDHVYWEDFVHEPARRWRECTWAAFRHYLTKAQVEKEFGEDAEILAKLKDEAWSKGAFVYAPAEAGEASTKATKSGEPRALIWECWDKDRRVVDWIIPGNDPVLLRSDEDTLELAGFFPCPEPMTSISTTESMVPVPEYEIWRDLAAEVARITERIDAIMKRMKVRGMYNGSIEELAEVLDGVDGKMVAVSGVDMEAAMSTNVWMIPLDMLANAAIALYGAREQAKQALYEVSGISDVLRGASNPNETATAQRIKGNFGTLRIDDRRRGLSAFLRELTRISAEIMASKFAGTTLGMMSGKQVTPEIEAYLRNEAQLMCLVDIETDSTVAADQATEQEASQTLVAAIGGLIQTFGPLVADGTVPKPFLVEMMKMILKPFKGSRDLLDMLGQMAEQAGQQPPEPPPPDPRAEAAKAKMEIDGAKAQQDMKIRQEEHGADMQERQDNMQMRQIEFRADMAERSAEIEAARALPFGGVM
ncbi:MULTISPECIES: hypothetical protein [unclassified Aureimonas]|uniref:hypothetical protein n=1 Tax=unclassified Aureimonas TaxID=2615206 RepID=UPI0006F5A071|nr:MULTISPECIES: hypothetical protein [unclassified Aureimonas]KQT52262.1 hypothetical protein ASG62_16535 [Aureimonas sp. Leaf427]KQT73236.1 hypothetical protein ASG54_17810 [Aureimonas sp. Leaf460]